LAERRVPGRLYAGGRVIDLRDDVVEGLGRRIERDSDAVDSELAPAVQPTFEDDVTAWLAVGAAFSPRLATKFAVSPLIVKAPLAELTTI
jgi:hypothetical protein